MSLRWHPAGGRGRLKSLVAERVRERIDPADLAEGSSTERRLHVREEALGVLREHRVVLPARELTGLVNEVSDEVVGLGPIEGLLRDPEITEVMLNGPADVFVERKGRIERVESGLFEGEEAVLHLIERIVGPLGLRVDESSPYVDARLPDGSRFHAILPPLSLCGPAVTVRKFGLTPLLPEDLARLGTATDEMLEMLGRSVRDRANILISGGAASGKTTLLGALSSFIPSNERIITIEDAAELRLGQPNIVRLEARPPNVEGTGAVTVRTLVRNALRMRPDRIIVGEVRGGETLDMLQAMNTGHEGSMSTAHANSPADLLARLETMALMSDVGLPVGHVREQIASTIDLLIHTTRLSDGRRVISRVTSVEGLSNGRPVLRDLFQFERGVGFRQGDACQTQGHSSRRVAARVGGGP
ncbi:MAG TPA: CpaF family protein [Actinomycetota bacterium]|nr:CpaF family protein [Actinomycetota bacterium]